MIDPFSLPGTKKDTPTKPSAGFTIQKKEPDPNPWWKKLGNKAMETAKKAPVLGPFGSLGSVGGFVGDVAKPFAKGVAESALTLGQAATFPYESIKAGSIKKGYEKTGEGLDVPYLGKIKPLRSPGRVLGTAGVLGSVIPKPTALGSAASGAMLGAGQALQEGEDAVSAGAKGAIGAAMGVGAHGVLKGGKGLLEKGISKTYKDLGARITEKAFSWGHDIRPKDLNAIKSNSAEILKRVQSVKKGAMGESGGMETPKFEKALSLERETIFNEASDVFEKAKKNIQQTFGKREATINTRLGDAKADLQPIRDLLIKTIEDSGYGVANRPSVKGAKLKNKFSIPGQKGGLDFTTLTDEIRNVATRINNTLDTAPDTSFQGMMKLKERLGDIFDDVETGSGGHKVLSETYSSLMDSIRGMAKPGTATAKQLDVMLGDYRKYLDTKSAFKNFTKGPPGTEKNAAQKSKALSDFWNTLDKKDTTKSDALGFFEGKVGYAPGTLENKMWGLRFAEELMQDKGGLKPSDMSSSIKGMAGKAVEALSGKLAKPEYALKVFAEQAKGNGIRVTPQYRKFLANIMGNPVLSRALGSMLTEQTTGWGRENVVPKDGIPTDSTEASPFESSGVPTGEEIPLEDIFSGKSGQSGQQATAPGASGENVSLESIFGNQDSEDMGMMDTEYEPGDYVPEDEIY